MSVIRRVLLCSLLCLTLAAPAAAQSASRWFLAEGASNAILEQEILVANPSASALTVTVRLLPDPGAQFDPSKLVRTFPLGPTARLTVSVAQAFPELNGAASAEVSAVVAGSTTPADIVVERTMYFPDGTRAGAHNASGVTQAATRWMFAEGASGVFSTFVLVANPNATEANVRVSYLKSTGEIIQNQVTIQPGQRHTFWPQEDNKETLTTAEFSTVVESLDAGKPIVAERAMYFDPAPSGSKFQRSGHAALGVPAASTTWYFAEGFTGGNAQIAFETFLLLANTNSTATTATVTYQLDSGEAISRDYVLDPNRRLTVWVDQEGRTFDPRLEASAFGITVEAPVPIVAERAMYWGTPSAPDPATPTFPWVEGHATAGSPVRAARWGFAEGAQDFLDASGLQYQTFLLFSNPNAASIAVRATYLRQDGTGIQRLLCVPAHGRANLWSVLYPELSNQRFSAFVESVATAAGDVCPNATSGGETYVAERAMYWGAGYLGGHVNMGMPWAGSITAPSPPNMTMTVAGLALEGTQNGRTGRLSGGEPVIVTGTNFTAGTEVYFGGRRATVAPGANPTTTLRVTTPRPSGGFGPTGTVPVTVRQPGGPNLPAGDFTFVFRVMAIGDSFTEGLLVDLIPVSPWHIDEPASPPYPATLRNWLRGDPRFGNNVVVANEGRSGECAAVAGCSGNGTSGRGRIAGLVKQTAWDAVIIMEGFNDQNDGKQGLGSIIAALRDMGRTAAASGATVVMGILDGPMDGLGGAIRSMADQEGFQRHSFRNIELGDDNVHPTQNGYDAMGRQAADKLKALFPQ